MNGLVHRPAIASLLSLAFATGAAIGCAPDNSVKPGAPVLLKFTVVQPGGVTVTIDSSAKICAAEIVNGAACRAVAGPAVPPSSGGGAGGSGGDTGAAGSGGGGGSVAGSGGSVAGSGGGVAGSGGSNVDGGATNPDGEAGSSAGGSGGESTTGAGGSTGEVLPADVTCQNEATKIWCTCDGATDPDAPVWVCQPFTRVNGVISTFDRLLDTVPLAPGPVAYGGPGAADTVTAEVPTGAPATTVLTDYASNGSRFGLLLPHYGALYYQNFRLDGPSLFTIPETAFPSGTIVTLKLDGTMVRAKDGHTPFTTDGGLLLDGILTFATSEFSAAVVASDLIAPDMSTITVAFTNVVDPKQVEGHIAVTATPGGPVPITVGAIDSNTIGVTPVDPWPAAATLTFTIDATTPNVLGQTLGSAITGTVMTDAN
jgi:hypothetical protein